MEMNANNWKFGNVRERKKKKYKKRDENLLRKYTKIIKKLGKPRPGLFRSYNFFLCLRFLFLCLCTYVEGKKIFKCVFILKAS